MKTTNDQYLDIIKRSKFISKHDEWFIEGTECELEWAPFPDYEDGDIFNKIDGVFHGMTMETYHGYTGELPRYDGEVCKFDEFDIYDEFGNNISELTLGEYNTLIQEKQ